MCIWRIVTHGLGIALGGLLGFGAARVLSHEEQKPSPRAAMISSQDAPSCSHSVEVPGQIASSSQFSLADIRAVVREELKAELAGQESRTKDPQVVTKPGDEATAERQRRIYDEASERLQRAIRYGTWTQEDRGQFRIALHELPIPQQDQIIGELFGAIQSGRLKVEGAGPPL